MPLNIRRKLQEIIATERIVQKGICRRQSRNNRRRTAAKPARKWNPVTHADLCASKFIRALRTLQKVLNGFPHNVALIRWNVRRPLAARRDMKPRLMRKDECHLIVKCTGNPEGIKTGTEIRTGRRNPNPYRSLIHSQSSCPSATRIRLRTSRTTGSARRASAAAEAAACVTTWVTATISASPSSVQRA